MPSRPTATGNSLVADRDIQESVHPQPDARGDVVVDPVEAGQLGPEPVIRSTRSSALPSPSVSRNADRNGAWTT